MISTAIDFDSAEMLQWAEEVGAPIETDMLSRAIGLYPRSEKMFRWLEAHGAMDLESLAMNAGSSAPLDVLRWFIDEMHVPMTEDMFENACKSASRAKNDARAKVLFLIERNCPYSQEKLNSLRPRLSRNMIDLLVTHKIISVE